LVTFRYAYFITLKSLLQEIGSYSHACEGEIICKLTNTKIPYFNGTIFLENKSKVGKVEEIFGPIDNSVSLLNFGCVLEMISLHPVIHNQAL